MKKVTNSIFALLLLMLVQSCSKDVESVADIQPKSTSESKVTHELLLKDTRINDYFNQKISSMKYMQEAVKNSEEKDIIILVSELENLATQKEFSSQDSTFIASVLGFKSVSDMNAHFNLASELSLQYPNLHQESFFIKHTGIQNQFASSSTNKDRRSCIRNCDIQYWTVGAGCIAASATLLPALACAGINAAIYYNCLNNCPQQ